MPVKSADHVDQLLAKIAEARVVDIDLDVEGIVDRIGSIHHRIKKAQKATLREHGLTPEEWGVLCSCGSAATPAAAPLAISRTTSSSRAAR